MMTLVVEGGGQETLQQLEEEKEETETAGAAAGAGAEPVVFTSKPFAILKRMTDKRDYSQIRVADKLPPSDESSNARSESEEPTNGRKHNTQGDAALGLYRFGGAQDDDD
jgi:hypothetical protein